MRVSDIQVERDEASCELRAQVLSESSLLGAFGVWYRFPGWCGEFLSAENGDPFLAALLPLAMLTGERLEIPAPVSPQLLRSIPEIQSIYSRFYKNCSRVDVRASLRTEPQPAESRTLRAGLFFSMGVDSFYSLLKNVKNHPHDEDAITHLIGIHGFDKYFGHWNSEFPPIVFDRMQLVAQELGKTLLPVVTNLRTFTQFTNWRMYHGAAMVSVALALGDAFQRVHIAASTSYEDLNPQGSHPVLDRLWSTEGLVFVHDGCELERPEKTRFVAESQLALDTLRVCPGYEFKYNCGRCGKCLETMIDLTLAGALQRCQTLSSDIDVEQLGNVLWQYPQEFSYKTYRRRFDALRAMEGQAELRAALAEYLEREAIRRAEEFLLAAEETREQNRHAMTRSATSWSWGGMPSERGSEPAPRRHRPVASVLRRLLRLPSRAQA